MPGTAPSTKKYLENLFRIIIARCPGFLRTFFKDTVMSFFCYFSMCHFLLVFRLLYPKGRLAYIIWQMCVSGVNIFESIHKLTQLTAHNFNSILSKLIKATYISGKILDISELETLNRNLRLVLEL